MTETQSMPQAWSPPTSTPAFLTPDSEEPNATLDQQIDPKSGTRNASPTSARIPAAGASPNKPGTAIVQQSPKPITGSRPELRQHARTSSSKILQKIRSRSSTYSSGAPPNVSNSPKSDAASMDLNGKIDREALSRAKGKYKSGVNWDMGLMLNLADEDAFMQSQSVDQEPSGPSVEDESQRALLASGGTAAAKAAYGQGRGYGSTIFPEEQIAAAEAAKLAQITAQQQDLMRRSAKGNRPFGGNPNFLSANGASGDHRSSSAQRGSSSSVSGFSSGSSVSPLPTANSLGAAFDPSSANTSHASSSSFFNNTSDTQQGSLVGKGKEVAQRASVRSSPTAEGGLSSTDFGKSSSEGSNNHSNNSNPPDKSPAASIKSKRRTFLGLTSKSTDKVDKTGKKSRRSSAVSAHLDSPGQDSEFGSGTVRKRRYPNTREMDVLAAQLRMEASLDQPPSPDTSNSTMIASGSRTPVDRRAKGISGTSSAASPSSQGHAKTPHAFRSFTPPFATPGRFADSPSSSGISSPPSGAAELPQVANLARAGAHKSPSASPSVTQKANISGMPNDMLTGLGHGPYPFITQEPGLSSPDGNTYDGNDATNASGKRGSQGASSLGPTSGGSKKTSVLSMTMHDPEAELQGLTKLPKSGKGTPWGSRAASRAPSRAVSPRTSGTNLRESAKQQQKEMPTNQLPASGASNISLTGLFSGQGGRRKSQGSEEKRSSGDAQTTSVAVPTPVVEDPMPVLETKALKPSPLAPSDPPRAKAVDGKVPEPARKESSSGAPLAPPRATLSPDTADATNQANLEGTTSSRDKRRTRMSFFGAFGKSRENVSSAPSAKGQSIGKDNSKRQSLQHSPTQVVKSLSDPPEADRPQLNLARTNSPARPPRSAQRPSALPDMKSSSPATKAFQIPTSASAGAVMNGTDKPSPEAHTVNQNSEATKSPKRPGFKRFISRFGSNSAPPKKSSQEPPPPVPADEKDVKTGQAIALPNPSKKQSQVHV
ncbi:unnamed protein product [Sympodiomycopsis kandeliae]